MTHDLDADERLLTRRHRVLAVLIDEVAVADGAIPPPQVGSITDFVLVFHESASTAANAMTVRGNLELRQIEPGHSDNPSTSRLWDGLLRGDGWTATWHGPQARSGLVEVTGQFYGVMGYASDPRGRVRGRITRVRVVSVPFRNLGRGRWEQILNGARTYRDVGGPYLFSRPSDLGGTESAVKHVEIGALVDLDLDDVPPDAV